MIDLYPAVIVRCQGPADVAATIRWARELGLPISVRGGGHNVAGSAVVDGGVVVDLSELRSVVLAKDGPSAFVGGGATWADVDAALAARGLATTGGLVSSTGVGGFTLGGGIGWLMRRHGLACDNLVGTQLVTAEGETVFVDETTDGELLWGLRGGGGNFGAVTSFQLAVHEQGQVVGGMLLYRLERATDPLAGFVRLAAAASDDLTLVAAFAAAPPAPFVPAELQGRRVAAIVACHRDPRSADRELSGIRALGKPDAEMVGPMPYPILQAMLDAGAPPGLRNYWKSTYLDALDPATLEILVDAAARSPSPLSQIHVHQLGGAVARVPASATAFRHRDSFFLVNVIGTWKRPAHDEAHVTWVRETHARLVPGGGEPYVNFMGRVGPDAVRLAYGDTTYDRLARLKARIDPDNVFRSNQNILPAR